ncbi:uncharacterized protein si:ch211-217k17.9 [Chanodichthys erythropterus]|uniref:uncharacterized protein si:ch211-217k17.9 n=1 Tax=Chanodichthys erythropterus TaxID=933992 RepID=UPI00351EA46F
MNVIGFSQGSVITKTEMFFNSSQSVPSGQVVAQTLSTAIASGDVKDLNIIPNSVLVNGSVSSSGLKIESSLLQATCLIIMSKILRLFL